MYKPEDFEAGDEPLRVRVPKQRSISISIDLSHEEATALFDLADEQGLGVIQTAHDIVIQALANRLSGSTAPQAQRR